MRIIVKPDSNWKKTRKLLRDYPRRIEYVQEQLCENIAIVFLDLLKKEIPSSKDFEQYSDSLKVVRLTGITPGVAFAIVSDRKKRSIKSLREEEGKFVAVYIEPKNLDSDAVRVVSSHNPWTLSMIPNGLTDDDVELVHRKITEKEFDFVSNETKKFVDANKVNLERLGLSFGKKVEDVEKKSNNMSSLPDYMWEGLRAEFGINSSRNPHWKPAVRKVASQVSDIIKKNRDLGRALYDGVFTKYLETGGSSVENMNVKEFEDEAGEFAGKISNVTGAKVK